jgi:hypothetical protein
VAIESNQLCAFRNPMTGIYRSIIWDVPEITPWSNAWEICSKEFLQVIQP